MTAQDLHALSQTALLRCLRLPLPLKRRRCLLLHSLTIGEGGTLGVFGGGGGLVRHRLHRAREQRLSRLA